MKEAYLKAWGILCYFKIPCVNCVNCDNCIFTPLISTLISNFWSKGGEKRCRMINISWCFISFKFVTPEELVAFMVLKSTYLLSLFLRLFWENSLFFLLLFYVYFYSSLSVAILPREFVRQSRTWTQTWVREKFIICYKVLYNNFWRDILLLYSSGTTYVCKLYILISIIFFNCFVF